MRMIYRTEHAADAFRVRKTQQMISCQSLEGFLEDCHALANCRVHTLPQSFNAVFLGSHDSMA